jgi:DnaJ-class molecular chaperone
MLLWLRKAWAWIKRIPKRITGFSTPLFGLSWREDRTPELKSDNRNGQSSDQADTIETKRQRVSCAYCKGNGRDPYEPGPCYMCHGSGELTLNFDNPVACRYCRGSARDPYEPGPCHVCEGVGFVRR